MRPRLRPTVQIHRQYFRGQMWHVVQDPSNNQFSRLSDAAYRFVALLDGNRTVAESWKICNEQLGDSAPTQGEAIQLLGQLYVSNLLLSEVPPDTASLFDRYKKRIRREVQGYLTNLLFVRIPIYDPEHFLNRWVGLFGGIFSVGGLIALILMLMTGLYCVSGMFGELFKYSRGMGMGTPGQEGILSPANLPILYLCFILVKVFHEFGHAFACKKFGRQEGSGGEVHVMGIMFLVFTPFPYVDASSSWAFRSKWRRMVVGAAGVLVELGIASIAAIVYSQTAEGAVLHKVAYNIIFVAGVSTVLFNGNPLLRYDGYYILSDLLEIPNLAQRSKQYIYYLVRKYAWGVRNLRSPAHTAGECAWMIAYGICSTIYRVFICVAILLFVADQLFLLGAVLAIAAIIAWVCVPLGKFAHYLASNTELMRVRGRAVGSTLATLVLIVAMVGLIPVADRFTLEGIVEPVEQASIFAEADGFIQKVLPSGRTVTPPGPETPGTEILLAENRDLELQRKQLAARLAAFEAERRLAQMQQQSKVQELDSAIQAVTKYSQYIDRQLESLHVRSSIAGTWISPECDRFVGAYAKKGQRLGTVVNLSRMKIVAISPQSVPLTSPGDSVEGRVEIRVKKRPPEFYAGLLIGRRSNELTGKIDRINPAAQQQLPSPALSYAAGGSIETDPRDKDNIRAAEPIFEVHILPDDSSQFMPGQRVEVRIRRQDKPLAEQWWLSILQLIQRRFHS